MKNPSERFEEMEAKDLEAANIILESPYRYAGLALEWAKRIKEIHEQRVVVHPVKAST